MLLKGKVRVISLRLTGREILVKGQDIHVGGGGVVEEVRGGVDIAQCTLYLPHPVGGPDGQQTVDRL